jgi:hypothetical protein
VILRRSVGYVSFFSKILVHRKVIAHDKHLNMLTKAGIVPGTIVESHRDADKEEDKLLSKPTGATCVLGLADLIRCVLLHRS